MQRNTIKYNQITNTHIPKDRRQRRQPLHNNGVMVAHGGSTKLKSSKDDDTLGDGRKRDPQLYVLGITIYTNLVQSIRNVGSKKAPKGPHIFQMFTVILGKLVCISLLVSVCMCYRFTVLPFTIYSLPFTVYHL